ncbi:MAG: hypothetical protein MJH09_05375 [Cetobacterium sp.]|nr:hypothetical protein [Cetobacterium sp.]
MYICIFLFLLAVTLSSIRFKSLKKTLILAKIGGEKSYPLLFIFIMLGILSASWFLSGTIPALIYYGTKIINPQYFYLSVFLILSIFSFLLGSCFGSVGTIGIVLLSLGKGFQMDTLITGGAIISGAYFGDRSSPISSSANFVAILTETNIYKNVKNMFKTGLIPFILTGFLYFYLGYSNTFTQGDISLINEIPKKFQISFLSFLPLFILIILSIIRCNLKKTLIFTSLSSFLLAIFYQNYSLDYIFKSTILGFHLDKSDNLASIIKGGGIVSMSSAVIMTFLSCGIVKLLENIGVFENISNKIGIIYKDWKLYLYLMFVSLFTAGASLSQSTSILLTSELMKKTYEKSGKNSDDLAIDIENTCVVLCGLVPWCISISVPSAMLELNSFSIIPWAFYLYLLPLINFFYKFQKKSDSH